MQHHISTSATTVRALSAAAAHGVVSPIRTTAIVVLCIGYAATIALAYFISGWWLLLLIVLIPATIIIGALSIAFSIGMRRLQPRPYTRDERKALKQFTHTVIGAATSIHTTPQRLAISVVKNSLLGKPSAILGDVMQNSTEVIEEYKVVRSIVEK